MGTAIGFVGIFILACSAWRLPMLNYAGCFFAAILIAVGTKIA